METLTNARGLTVFTKDKAAQETSLWRPWTGEETHTGTRLDHSVQGDLFDSKHLKAPLVVHPVKLYWPKSKCFDYLYQDAEVLLRNYPVQATICPCEDSSSDEDSDDEEEEMEKELN